MITLLRNTNIPFMKYRRVAYAFSGLLMVAAVVYMIAQGGPKMSVDFTGGTLLQIRTQPAIAAEDARRALAAAGIEGAELQSMTGDNRDEFLLRIGQGEGTENLFDRVRGALLSASPNTQVELRRQESVGPKVGSELREKAMWAVLGSLLGILVYVGIRYEFKFALGAVVALFHDVFMVLAMLSFTGREVSLTVVAALLTIAGFSINDTIVVFDRIRERSKALKKESHTRVMDIAVNETLSRTVITALTVFFTALALFFWGGEVLNDFSFAMLVGLVFGMYSSVYIASGLALDMWIALERRKGIQAE